MRASTNFKVARQIKMSKLLRKKRNTPRSERNEDVAPTVQPAFDHDGDQGSNVAANNASNDATNAATPRLAHEPAFTFPPVAHNPDYADRPLPPIPKCSSAPLPFLAFIQRFGNQESNIPAASVNELPAASVNELLATNLSDAALAAAAGVNAGVNELPATNLLNAAAAAAASAGVNELPATNLLNAAAAAAAAASAAVNELRTADVEAVDGGGAAQPLPLLSPSTSAPLPFLASIQGFDNKKLRSIDAEIKPQLMPQASKLHLPGDFLKELAQQQKTFVENKKSRPLQAPPSVPKKPTKLARKPLHATTATTTTATTATDPYCW